MTRARPLGLVAAAALVAAVAAAMAPVASGRAGLGSRAGAATPASPLRAFVGGAVRFALPRAWEVQGFVSEGAAEGVAVAIPCAPLDPTPHSANVNVLAEPNAGGEDLRAWSARRLAVAAPRRVLDERLEPGWRTVVSAGEDRSARYVVVERFGVSARGRVHAVAAFPCLPEMGDAWFARAGAEIDGFLASLALEGAPPSAVRIAWDGRTLRFADPARRPEDSVPRSR
jgi:hypothetical protein